MGCCAARTLCLPPWGRASLLARPAARALWSVLQAEGVQQKSLSSCPQVQAAAFIAGWWFHPGPEAEGSAQATGDDSQASAGATSVCALGPQGPFRTGLCAVPLARHVETSLSHACPPSLSTLAQIRSVTAGGLCLGALWDSWQGSDQGGRRKHFRTCLCKKLF